MNQIPIASDRKPSRAAETEESPDDSALGLFGSLLLNAQNSKAAEAVDNGNPETSSDLPQGISSTLETASESFTNLTPGDPAFGQTPPEAVGSDTVDGESAIVASTINDSAIAEPVIAETIPSDFPNPEVEVRPTDSSTSEFVAEAAVVDEPVSAGSTDTDLIDSNLVAVETELSIPDVQSSLDPKPGTPGPNAHAASIDLGETELQGSVDVVQQTTQAIDAPETHPDLPLSLDEQQIDPTNTAQVVNVDDGETTQQITQQPASPAKPNADIEDPDLEEFEEVDTGDRKAVSVERPVKDIATQLQIIANKAQSAVASVDSENVRAVTKKQTPGFGESIAIDQAVETLTTNADVGFAAMAEAPSSAELDTTPKITTLPPTHGLQKIVSELVSEAGDVVDSKTLSVRFEEPHIGRVQLEMAQSADGITVNISASDDITLEMLNANHAGLERTLKDQQIELLEIASLPMDTATYNSDAGEQQFHREAPNAYQQSSNRSSIHGDSPNEDLQAPELLDFRA